MIDSKRDCIWVRCSKFMRPLPGEYVRVVDEPKKYLNDAMREWIAEHKDKTFKVRVVVEDSVMLYGVEFSVSLDLVEVSLCATE